MRSARSAKCYSDMTADELAAATAELDREFVVDAFGPLDPTSRARWRRAKRKRGRPVRGAGAKAISVTVELSLLRRVDALARRLSVPRARLIEHGLRAVLASMERRRAR